ncbi:hypothetical protein H4582DRAFT_2052658 [Lactarius indigo]|nr:hypothetical protein H4582DRAFT_2052658 [Lactarius indigo]
MSGTLDKRNVRQGGSSIGFLTRASPEALQASSAPSQNPDRTDGCQHFSIDSHSNSHGGEQGSNANILALIERIAKDIDPTHGNELQVLGKQDALLTYDFYTLTLI